MKLYNTPEDVASLSPTGAQRYHQFTNGKEGIIQVQPDYTKMVMVNLCPIGVMIEYLDSDWQIHANGCMPDELCDALWAGMKEKLEAE